MNQSAALPESVGAAVSVPYPLRRPLVLLVPLAAGVIAALSFWRSPSSSPGLFDPFVGRPALLIGRVAGLPVGTAEGDYFLLSSRWVQPSGVPAFRSKNLFRVFRKNPAEPVLWGDEISVWGPLLSADGKGLVQGVEARLFVPEGRSVLLRRVSPFHPIRWTSALRDRVHETFKKHLPESSDRLLSGVLLGDRPPGLSEFTEDFRRSGLLHLLVASGSNVGFAIGAWWMVSRWILWWPRRWALAGAPVVSFFYAFMAGGEAPVLRAAVMASVGSMGVLLGRRDRLVHPLVLSAGFLLAWDPSCLFQVGFQMSYAATLAVAIVWDLDGKEEDEPGGGPPRRGGGRLKRWTWELFVSSLAAQVALAPWLLHYFGRFSWVGIGANIVAVPLSGACLLLGTGLTVLDGVWPAAASLWAIPTRWGAEALAGWAHLCAQIPGAEWHRTLNGERAVLLAFGVAFGFFVLHLKKKKGPLFFASVGMVLCLVGDFSFRPPLPVCDISWSGGRDTVVRVRSKEGSWVYERGNLSRFPPGSLPLRPLPEDGARWSEGGMAGEFIRPDGGDGYAFSLRSDKTTVLLNFGLTARQQAEWVRRGPGRTDLLSWMGGKGGPPTSLLLSRLNPRWIVYSGGRVPLSVRRSGGAIHRPGRDGLRWREEESHSGFCSPAQNW